MSVEWVSLKMSDFRGYLEQNDDGLSSVSHCNILQHCHLDPCFAYNTLEIWYVWWCGPPSDVNVGNPHEYMYQKPNNEIEAMFTNLAIPK